MGALCVLPARLSSTRIPHKPLQVIQGRPLVEWTWRAACRVPGVARIIVATDAEEVFERASEFGAEVLLTSPEHASGTDRVNEVADRLAIPDRQVILNFQADEPFVDPGAVERAVGLASQAESVVTLAAPIDSENEFLDPAVVKLVLDPNGRVLYFSRAPIPWDRDGARANGAGGGAGPLRHIGVYAARRGLLRRWATLPESALERTERLEQLRGLEAGIEFRAIVGDPTEPGIDTRADLERAAGVFASQIDNGSMPG